MAKRKLRPAAWLKGKIVGFMLDPSRHRKRCGWYMGRVVRVHTSPRGGLRGVTVRMASYPGPYGGEKMRIHLAEMMSRAALCGVEYRHEIVRLPEIIAGVAS